MVVLSESYLQHLGHKAMVEALTMQIQSKTFKRYVDDGHVCFTVKHHANIFQKILNKQDPAIQYSIEYENENKSFLDINITITINSKYEFKVHHKMPLPTYISNQHRASTLTSSKVYSNVSFTEHTRYVLKNISKKKKSF